MKKVTISIIILLILGIAGYFGYDYYKNNGKKYEYFSNGQTERIYHLKNGKIDGTSAIFHDDGNIHAIEHYKNGKLEGESTVYYRNGKIASITYWINGNYDYTKPQTSYYENKDIHQEYSKGNYVSYYKNGKIEEEGKYNSSGDRIGDYKQYDEEGNLIAKGTYKDGRIYSGDRVIYQTTFDEDGKENRIIWKIDTFADGEIINTKLINKI